MRVFRIKCPDIKSALLIFTFFYKYPVYNLNQYVNLQCNYTYIILDFFLRYI